MSSEDVSAGALYDEVGRSKRIWPQVSGRSTMRTFSVLKEDELGARLLARRLTANP